MQGLKYFTNVQDFLGHSIGVARSINHYLSAKRLKTVVNGEIIYMTKKEDLEERERQHKLLDDTLDLIYKELKAIDKPLTNWKG